MYVAVDFSTQHLIINNISLTPIFMRARNTNIEGGQWTSEQINAVWKKGRIVGGQHPDRMRVDSCGALIAYERYGKKTKWGWEIDHRQPVAKGGTDDISNLYPLQWENNRHKGDDWPEWTCLVTSW
jgi:hypothetical protein